MAKNQPFKSKMNDLRFSNVIGWRLLLRVLLFSSLVTLTGIALQLYLEFQKDVVLQKKVIESIKLTQTKSIGEALWNIDLSQMEAQMEDILQITSVEYVEIEPSNQFKYQTMKFSKGKIGNKRYHEFKIPLFYNDIQEGRKDIGHIRIVSNYNLIFQRFKERILVIILIQAIKTFLVSFFILFIVHYLLTRHLSVLNSYLGDFNLEKLTEPLILDRKSAFRDDELDRIVETLNAQRQKLFSAYLDLEYRNKELLYFNKTKDQFLVDISQEIKTPISGIVGIAETIMTRSRDQFNQEDSTDLDLIINCGNQVLNLIDDTLDYSRLKFKEIKLNLRPLDVRSLADVILSFLKGFVAKKNVVIHNQLSADLPMVQGDEAKVQQILFNIVSNAIKYTNEGSIELFAQKEENFLFVTVEDTGVGITTKDLQQISSYFKTNEGPGRKKEKPLGSGLGLSISRQLVELHGGEMWIESVENQGTKVTFSLPIDIQIELKQTPVKLLDVTDSKKENLPGANVFESRQMIDKRLNYQILVVEDDPMVQRVLNNYLMEEDYDVVLVDSGEDALSSIASGKPDLVILDAVMPKMNGYEVCNQIRNKYSARELPVIMLSAREEKYKNGLTKMPAMINDFIEKPIHKHELMARVKNQIKMMLSNQRIASHLTFAREIREVKDTNKLLMCYYKHVEKNVICNALILFHDKEVIRQTGDEKLVKSLSQYCLTAQKTEDKLCSVKITDTPAGFMIFSSLKGFDEYAICIFRNEINRDFSDIIITYLESINNEIYEIRSNIHKIAEDSTVSEAVLMIKKMMKQITFIKAASPFCEIVLDGIDEAIEIPITMQEIELYFGESDLFRIHRQYIVIPNKAWGVRKKNPKDYDMVFGKSEIPIGRTYLKKLKAKHSYLFDK